jgi:hypothetical protein
MTRIIQNNTQTTTKLVPIQALAASKNNKKQ